MVGLTRNMAAGKVLMPGLEGVREDITFVRCRKCHWEEFGCLAVGWGVLLRSTTPKLSDHQHCMVGIGQRQHLPLAHGGAWPQLAERGPAKTIARKGKRSNPC